MVATLKNEKLNTETYMNILPLTRAAIIVLYNTGLSMSQHGTSEYYKG